MQRKKLITEHIADSGIPMLEKHRQQLIKDILDQQQFASVRSLTEKLNSSEATIRRDITKMAQRNEIKKIRGGAESINGEPIKKHIASSAFMVDKAKNSETKKRIAKRAVEMCSDGDSIIINGGSSTYMMGEYLSAVSVNILTNSFVLASHITENTDNQVSLPGGEIYREQGIILSSYENDCISYYHANLMFMGSPGIGKFGVIWKKSNRLRLSKHDYSLHEVQNRYTVVFDVFWRLKWHLSLRPNRANSKRSSVKMVAS